MKKNTFWFKMASYALVVTAGLHMLGHFAGAEPANETEETLLELMTIYRFDFGGIERSMMDFLNGYSLTFAATFFFVGVLNLAVIRAGAGDPSFIRTVTLIDSICTGVLLTVSIAYFIRSVATDGC